VQFHIQFIVSGRTGIAVGNESSGMAKMYQMIDTLASSADSPAGSQGNIPVAEVAQFAFVELALGDLPSSSKEGDGNGD
jgi:hypothetical protein